MKRTILLMTLVLACVGVAGAQTIDPSIIILGGGGGTVSIPGTTFSFSTTGSDCNFTSPSVVANDCTILNNNTGGGNWIAVSFLISQTVSPSNVMCNTAQTGSLFASCVVTPVPTITGDPTMVTLSGGPGIPLGMEGLISISGWNTGTTFSGTATVTPEPASIALLLTGGGLLVARRKLRKGSCASQR